MHIILQYYTLYYTVLITTLCEKYYNYSQNQYLLDRQSSHSNALYTLLLLLQYTYTLRTLHMTNSILEPYGPVNEGLLYANKTLV